MLNKSIAARKNIIRIVVLAVLLLMTYVADMVPFTFWRAVSPDFLVVFAITVSMFAPPLTAACFAVAAGLLKDLSSTGIFGFHGILYLVLAVAVSLVVALLIRRSFTNALIINAVGIIMAKSFYYFIFNVLFEKGGRIALFYRSVIPSIFITILIVPITYFIIKKINDYLGEEEL
ncbi:MAG: rod shape-determining protein MreD [Oscillospiraceae bacterium]|nr:rod shape-determining protein MreD [Oscillospiraceae bacterium]